MKEESASALGTYSHALTIEMQEESASASNLNANHLDCCVDSYEQRLRRVIRSYQVP